MIVGSTAARSVTLLLLLGGCLVCPLPLDAQSLEFGPPYVIIGGFQTPFGVAIDRQQQHLLVADTKNRQIVWTSLATLTGTPTFQSFGLVADLTAPDALVDPEGIAADGVGHVYVVDARKNQVNLYTWNPTAGNYLLDPSFASATRNIVAGVGILAPRDIAVGPDGRVYLLDSGRDRVLRADGPTSTSWNVFLSDPTLGNPYGIDVGPDGRIYIADTDHNRIVRYEVTGAPTVFGSFGTGPAQFRAPRDVAVDATGRMYVVDTHNHRLEIIDQNGLHVISLGQAPAFGSVQKVALDANRHVYLVDGDNDAVVAFLGSAVPVPFDGWIRDYIGDDGTEPSDPSHTLASPDILVRHAADVDIAAAQTSGLETIAFESARFERDNYVYVAVRNRGTQPLSGGVAKVYWLDPASPLQFPVDWHAAGFFTDASTAGNTLDVPLIAPGGVAVVGPVRWRPPAPELAGLGSGTSSIGVRLVYPFDVALAGGGPAAIRASNDVAVRTVHVVRGPFPTGAQNTLIVRVRYADDATPINEASVQSAVASAASWVKEVSWGEASIMPLYRGEIALPRSRAYYQDPMRSMLVEMADDALQILLASEPNLLDGTSPIASDVINRVILVTNDVTPDVDLATTGPWPYHTPSGADRYLTVSIQAMNNTPAAFEHGLGHQFSMVDLYPYPNVMFPQPLADGWDVMAKPFTGVHPTVWSKQFPAWVTGHGATITFVPRPGSGATYTTGTHPLPLYKQATAQANQPIAIALGTTPGVGTLTDETAFYYLEARSGGDGNADAALPGSGVLMYYVNSQIPQGQGPLQLRDHVPATPTLADAAIPIGSSESPPGTGITASVRSGTVGGADYQIDLTYTPPPTYDLSLNPGDPAWTSPDIWVDNQEDGYEEENGLTPTDRGEPPIGGEENRLYARIHNFGPGHAFNVEVAFFISEPYHTVGGEADFTLLESKIIADVPPGDMTTYVKWTPHSLDPHSCVRVVLRRLTGDINPANNAAQKNFMIQWSTSHSPFTPVQFTFQIKNGATTQQLVYFRADGIPASWARQLTPEKAYLAPSQVFTGTLTVKPPADALNCTQHDIYVTAWTPASHTLVRLGGTTVRINLANKARMRFGLETVGCTDQNYRAAAERQQRELTRRANMRAAAQQRALLEAGRYRLALDHEVRLDATFLGTPDSASVSQGLRGLANGDSQLRLDVPDTANVPCVGARDRQCHVFHATGCTMPAQANVDVIIRYRPVGGPPMYHTVKANAQGCFEDYYATTDAGTWQVTASVAGSNCLSPIDTGADVLVGPTRDLAGGLDYGRPERITPVSFAISKAELVLRRRHGTTCIKCQRTLVVEHDITLQLQGVGTPSGILRGPELRTVFPDAGGLSGVHGGAARVRLADGSVIDGAMHGVTNVPTSWRGNPLASNVVEITGQFIGRALEGPHRGCRFVLNYVLRPAGDVSRANAAASGTSDGVWECGCGANGTARVAAVDSLAEGCVFPFVATGSGRLATFAARTSTCDKASPARVELDSDSVRLLVGAGSNSVASAYIQGSLGADSVVQVFTAASPLAALHAAPFTLVTEGRARVRGLLEGITHTPSATAAASSPLTASWHAEGLLRGDVNDGPLAGCELLGVYRTDARGGTLGRWSMAGAIVCPCAVGDVARSKRVDSVPPVSVAEVAQREEMLRRRALDSALATRFGTASNLTPTERALADVDGDGQVTAEEVANFRLARRDFDARDMNHDGRLTREEFLSGAVRKTVEQLLARFDKNGDGKLDSMELRVVPVAARARMDANHDGMVTADELQEWATESANLVFSGMDAQRRGSITFAEWYHAMRRSSRGSGGRRLPATVKRPQ